MVYTIPAPNPATTDVKVYHRPTLETALEAALEHARRLTDMATTNPIDVAIAWETVEELRVARRRQSVSQLSAFDRYCEANPDAPECRIYDC
ncbi:MAG: Calvin cycle protein CP12 [Cyanobacteria bacterium P01_A01_bin.123]